MKQRNRLLVTLVVLGMAVVTGVTEAALWSDANGPGVGWKQSAWFGWFYSDGDGPGWVFHDQHGWVYATGTDSSNVWLWSTSLGWTWTAQGVYPYLYRVDENSWVWYSLGSVAPRWFYGYRHGAWFCDQLMPSASFSPVTARYPTGHPEILSWTYLVNGGQPLIVEKNGVTLDASFSDLQLTIDPAQLVRTVQFAGSYSGDGSGTLTTTVAEGLTSQPGGTFIQSQVWDGDVVLSVMGFDLETIFHSKVDGLTSPVEWFLDRADLDTLPIGYVEDQRGTIQGNLAGTITVASLLGSATTNLNQVVTIGDRWEITGSQPTITVLGVTYSNIVVVTRTTVVPNADTGAPEPVEMTYSVAKGVGMVRGINQYQVMGQPLVIELKHSNLRP